MVRKIALIGLRFAGVLLLETSILMSWFGPAGPVTRNPDGFLTPVCGLELALSDVEVEHILGVAGSVEGTSQRLRVQQATIIDYFFIACYAALQLVLGFYLWDRGVLQTEVLALVGFLSVGSGIADVQENRAILGLLDATSAEALWLLLPALHAWTVLKWSGLGLVSAIFASSLVRLGNPIHASLFGLTALLAFAGLFYRPLIEWQAVFLAVAWTVTWYKSFPLPMSWARRDGLSEPGMVPESPVAVG